MYYKLDISSNDLNTYFKYNDIGLSIKKNSLKLSPESNKCNFNGLIEESLYDEIISENKNKFIFDNKININNKDIIKIYSDGAVFNQGLSLKEKVGELMFGSYAFIILDNDKEIYRSKNLIRGNFDNNQIELLSICQALNILYSLSDKSILKNKYIIINTDSKLSIDFIISKVNIFYALKKCNTKLKNNNFNFYNYNMRKFLNIISDFIDDPTLNFYVKWIKSHQEGCSIFNKENIYNNLVDYLCSEMINDELKKLKIDNIFKTRFNKPLNNYVKELL